LEAVHPDAAGIDIGSREHYVAVRAESGSASGAHVRMLYRRLTVLGGIVRASGVKNVAMQCTGVYWIPVYEVLEQHGFEVWVLNVQDTRNLPGRNSDMHEKLDQCRYLLGMHIPDHQAVLPPTSFRRAAVLTMLCII